MHRNARIREVTILKTLQGWVDGVTVSISYIQTTKSIDVLSVLLAVNKFTVKYGNKVRVVTLKGMFTTV